MTNDESVVVRCLLATVTWHVECESVKGRGGDGEYSHIVDGDNIMCCHHQTAPRRCCRWDLGIVVVVEENHCALLMAPKSSVGKRRRLIWA
jgi:hypothetical protein